MFIWSVEHHFQISCGADLLKNCWYIPFFTYYDLKVSSSFSKMMSQAATALYKILKRVYYTDCFLLTHKGLPRFRNITENCFKYYSLMNFLKHFSCIFQNNFYRFIEKMCMCLTQYKDFYIIVFVVQFLNFIS